MDRELSVLLVEDDQIACKEILEYIEDFNDMHIIGVTNNASRAVENIRDYAPDAIILDLELHQGSGNGLLVLQEMNQLSLLRRPYVLVTTNNSSQTTYEYARQLGADFIMSKHQDDYSAKNPVDFLRMMKTVIHDKANKNRPSLAEDENPDIKRKGMVRRIGVELDCIGISPKAIGYQYLITAIQLMIEKPTQNICSIVAQKYGKTESSVERAMQNAISRAWRVSDIEDLLRLYTAKISSEKGVPTITEFICFYAHKIKNEY